VVLLRQPTGGAAEDADEVDPMPRRATGRPPGEHSPLRKRVAHSDDAIDDEGDRENGEGQDPKAENADSARAHI
jgi:hypothetical protein